MDEREFTIGQKVYNATVWVNAKGVANVTVNESEVVKVTGKMVYLSNDIDYTRRMRKCDKRMSLTPKEALIKLRDKSIAILVGLSAKKERENAAIDAVNKEIHKGE